MASDIHDYVSSCTTCRVFQPNQQKEPIIHHEIPSRSWQIIASDLFELQGRNYLVTVDFYSNFCEADRLHTTTSAEVIKASKQHMARHGLPEKLISDNAPQYSSEEFRIFAGDYELQHVTSSPTYSQSNGKAKSAVKQMKSLMIKAIESKSDVFLALLDWRNTPSEGIPCSPAQRLFGRRTRTLLSTSKSLLRPKIVTNIEPHLKKRKDIQAKYYNRGTRELMKLYPGQLVRMKPDRRKRWRKGRIERHVDIRSYLIRTEDGGLYRRNRRHLRHTRAPDEFQPFTKKYDYDCSISDPYTSSYNNGDMKIQHDPIINDNNPNSSVLVNPSVSDQIKYRSTPPPLSADLHALLKDLIDMGID
uniref:uncharacterized protein K02A2.6-like n=1 Tax=Styela clava TaxID=7725 RepID=UPI0019397BCF|nr:uncharacterized protein K02A2.6-like [Styela clava]